jgi:S-adenosylmethionine decarboxylase
MFFVWRIFKMTKQPFGYGPHLMLDLNGCNQKTLDDLEACFKLLSELPGMVGMTAITQPYVFRYDSVVPDDAGITGVVIIAESHISLHTYPKKHFAFVDLFSCKPFDVEKAKSHIIRFFESTSPMTYVQERGRDFPATMLKAS